MSERAECVAPWVGEPVAVAMEEDDIDDYDQPRVVYADAEREGRMARYATGAGDCADVSASRGSHGASEGGVFAPRGPAPGAALWASDDDMDGAPPPTLLEEEDDPTSPPSGDDCATVGAARSDRVEDPRSGDRRRSDGSITDDDVVDASPAAVFTREAVPFSRARVRYTGPPPGTTGGDAENSVDDADRDFLEETLGNVSAAARVIARRNAEPAKRAAIGKLKATNPKPPAPRRSPRGKAAAANSAEVNRKPTKLGGLASLASLGALSRGLAPAKFASRNEAPSAEASQPEWLAQNQRAARRTRVPSGSPIPPDDGDDNEDEEDVIADEDEDEDGIDDDEEDDSKTDQELP